MINYSFDEFSGATTLLVEGEDGNVSTQRNILLSNIISSAIDLGFENKITIIEMCPDKTVFKNLKFADLISEHVDNLDRINDIKPDVVHWPRIYGKAPKDIVKFSSSNSRTLLDCLDQYRRRPTRILFINELNFYLHMGTIHWLMETISKSSTFIGTCFRAKFPYSDHNTGISRRERRLIDRLSLTVDDVISL